MSEYSLGVLVSFFHMSIIGLCFYPTRWYICYIGLSKYGWSNYMPCFFLCVITKFISMLSLCTVLYCLKFVSDVAIRRPYVINASMNNFVRCHIVSSKFHTPTICRVRSSNSIGEFMWFVLHCLEIVTDASLVTIHRCKQRECSIRPIWCSPFYFSYNNRGQTLVRDFMMWWTCVIRQYQSHHLQESLSETATQSHLSLMLNFLCIHLVSSRTTTAQKSKRATTSKMPPFFLLFFGCFYWRWKTCRILHRSVIKITLQKFSLPSVFCLPLYCYVLWPIDMVNPEFLRCIQE
jgi:hypothetical protein